MAPVCTLRSKPELICHHRATCPLTSRQAFALFWSVVCASSFESEHLTDDRGRPRAERAPRHQRPIGRRQHLMAVAQLVASHVARLAHIIKQHKDADGTVMGNAPGFARRTGASIQFWQRTIGDPYL